MKKQSKKSEMVSIDSKKLRDTMRDKNMKKFSIALGYKQNYMSRSIENGRINREFLEKTCLLIGTKADEYVVTDSVKESPRNAAVLPATDAATLLELIGELERRVNGLENWQRRVQG